MEARRAEQITAAKTLEEEKRKYDVRLNEVTKEHRATIARLRAEQDSELARKDAEALRRSVVHDQGAVLTAEIESLRSVLELKSQENATLRSELDSFKRDVEDKDALQLRLDTLEARCEDLKAQLQSKDNYERQVSHENDLLHESIHQISKQNKRLAQRNEELQWRLRQKSEWVSVLANQLAGPRLSRSAGSEHVEHSFSSDKNDPHSSSVVKFVVEKSDSVAWTLEIDDESSKGVSDSLSRLPKQVTRPSEPTATVSRQGSLRLTPKQSTNTDTRTRSKSISAVDASRTEDISWSPAFSSTPTTRRRPRSNDQSSSSSSSSTTFATPSASPAVAAAVAAAAEDCNVGQNQPQEAGGEAMISEETSASSSEDESSIGSDIPRIGMQFAWGKPIK